MRYLRGGQHFEEEGRAGLGDVEPLVRGLRCPEQVERDRVVDLHHVEQPDPGGDRPPADLVRGSSSCGSPRCER